MRSCAAASRRVVNPRLSTARFVPSCRRTGYLMRKRGPAFVAYWLIPPSPACRRRHLPAICAPPGLHEALPSRPGTIRLQRWTAPRGFDATSVDPHRPCGRPGRGKDSSTSASQCGPPVSGPSPGGLHQISCAAAVGRSGVADAHADEAGRIRRLVIPPSTRRTVPVVEAAGRGREGGHSPGDLLGRHQATDRLASAARLSGGFRILGTAPARRPNPFPLGEPGRAAIPR
jgi:hypothetical protein